MTQIYNHTRLYVYQRIVQQLYFAFINSLVRYGFKFYGHCAKEHLGKLQILRTKTEPLWHWGEWKSGPTSQKDHRPRYVPTGKCPLYKYKATGQLLHSEICSNQVGCSCTRQRSLSCETNTGATDEIAAPNQSWRGCNHPTSNVSKALWFPSRRTGHIYLYHFVQCPICK